MDFESSKLWEGIPFKELKKIKEQDNQIVVNEYEEKNNKKIHIIFNKEGIPCFPDKNRILEKKEFILIGDFKRD